MSSAAGSARGGDIAPVFAALGDPTRRQIVELLMAAEFATATGLAGRLDISRQAVAKHLGLLADAGLAASQRVGRETRFVACVEPLVEVTRWVDLQQQQWDTRLGLMRRALADRPLEAP